MTKAKRVVKKSSGKGSKKKTPTLVKVLEGIVLVGAVAGILIKLFKGGRKKK